ncbi:hypothetical protein EU527_11095 [Candidatus Thorarchaeota archaeon]|nr:MAG: hypothetical protein EU527_11095 [Candidatus Thorarchaeota archaeon]
MPGFIIRKDNGDMKWFPLFYYDGKYKFYPPKGAKTGQDVGRDWNFVKYLPGYWTPTSVPSYRRRIGGGSDLVVLDNDGNLKFFPFKQETFMHMGTGDKVGRGFRESLDYFVAEWTGNGTSDLLVRDEDGNLRLFIWNGKEFKDLGRDEKVGNGFDKKKVPDIYPGYWTGGSTPDIMIRKDNGDLIVFPFNGKTFYGQDKIKVGDGFKPKNYPHLLIGEWLGNGTPDMLAYRDKRMHLYPYGMVNPKKNHFTFTDNYQWRSDKDFREDWIYLVGHWRIPGKPDLITLNKSNDLWFYPFDDGALIDLKNDKQVGNDWKVTHFFDFYPI